jgi:FkbM family methyltransferase
MKKVLRKVFSEKHKKLDKFNRKIFTSFIHVITTILPDRFLLGIKTHALVKKMDYEHCAIFLNIDSAIEYDTRLHSCKKEPETIEWIETFFKEGDVFFDIGANVGAYSLVASKFFNRKIKVYAFEPGFPTFVQLCKNMLLNGCQESIVPLQIALSDKTIVDNFNYHDLIPGGALHAFGEAIDNKGNVFKPVFKQPILSYRIDDLVKQFEIQIPNHIKIDVDGLEFSILEGSDETLSNPLVRSILVELEEGGEEANQIIEFLARKNFEVHSKHKCIYGAETGQFSKMYNYIFLRKSD